VGFGEQEKQKAAGRKQAAGGRRQSTVEVVAALLRISRGRSGAFPHVNKARHTTRPLRNPIKDPECFKLAFSRGDDNEQTFQ
jgi:hypothetical protein